MTGIKEPINTTSDGTFLSVVCEKPEKSVVGKSWGATAPPGITPLYSPQNRGGQMSLLLLPGYATAYLLFFVVVIVLCVCVCACVRACGHACVRACMRACMCTCVRACVRVCVVCVCVCSLFLYCLSQKIHGDQSIGHLVDINGRKSI